MSGRPRLRIGTRGSDLALWQAHRVAHLLDDRLGHDAEIVIIKTQGDRIQNVAFHKMEGKGFFTKELQEALLDDRVDLVVHSLKDLPTEEPDGLAVAAIPERHLTADLLLARPGVLPDGATGPADLPDGAVLGTSSLRRAAQALSAQPRIRLEALRGNVPTRIGKLRDGKYDAILIAAAGVGRLELDLSDLVRVELVPEIMLPAPGQGALAIETRAGDPTSETLRRLHDDRVARAIAAERGLLSMLGGGCHLPLGCLADVRPDGTVRLQASLGEIDEELTRARMVRVDATGDDPDAVAKACHDLLRRQMPEVATS
jgi:hydroxymethylbilane synthase